MGAAWGESLLPVETRAALQWHPLQTLQKPSSAEQWGRRPLGSRRLVPHTPFRPSSRCRTIVCDAGARSRNLACTLRVEGPSRALAHVQPPSPSAGVLPREKKYPHHHRQPACIHASSHTALYKSHRTYPSLFPRNLPPKGWHPVGGAPHLQPPCQTANHSRSSGLLEDGRDAYPPHLSIATPYSPLRRRSFSSHLLFACFDRSQAHTSRHQYHQYHPYHHDAPRARLRASIGATLHRRPVYRRHNQFPPHFPSLLEDFEKCLQNNGVCCVMPRHMSPPPSNSFLDGERLGTSRPQHCGGDPSSCHAAMGTGHDGSVDRDGGAFACKRSPPGLGARSVREWGAKVVRTAVVRTAVGTAWP